MLLYLCRAATHQPRGKLTLFPWSTFASQTGGTCVCTACSGQCEASPYNSAAQYVCCRKSYPKHSITQVGGTRSSSESAHVHVVLILNWTSENQRNNVHGHSARHKYAKQTGILLHCVLNRLHPKLRTSQGIYLETQSRRNNPNQRFCLYSRNCVM